MVRESEYVCAQVCDDAAAASSRTSARCPRRCFGIRIITVMLPFRGLYLRRDVSVLPQGYNIPFVHLWSSTTICESTTSLFLYMQITTVFLQHHRRCALFGG